MPGSRALVFDPVLKRPGCVLLQAAHGVPWADMELTFPSSTWLLAPTPDMAVFEATPNQVQKLVAMAVHATEGRKP